MVRKQVLFLGDDGYGVYESTKRDLHPPAQLYAAAKAVCNLFWLGSWTILLLSCPTLFRSTGWPVWYGICVLPLLYQWAIDSVFESGGRHHVPYICLVAIMVGIALNSRPVNSRTELAMQAERRKAPTDGHGCKSLTPWAE